MFNRIFGFLRPYSPPSLGEICRYTVALSSREYYRWLSRHYERAVTEAERVETEFKRRLLGLETVRAKAINATTAGRSRKKSAIEFVTSRLDWNLDNQNLKSDIEAHAEAFGELLAQLDGYDMSRRSNWDCSVRAFKECCELNLTCLETIREKEMDVEFLEGQLVATVEKLKVESR